MLRPPRSQPTPFWHQLSAYLGLDAPVALTWWQALASSRWTLACAWRQKILLGERYGELLVTPDVLLEVVQQLAQEGHLPRRVCQHIEESILTRLDKDRRWR
jgi:hypothetical protein